MREFGKWAPHIRVLLFHGNKSQRQKLKVKINKKKGVEIFSQTEEMLFDKFDVCITNYESLKSEKYVFSKFFWRYIVTDEAHRFKSDSADIYTTVRRLRSQYKLLLTGTPLQNNLHELWALLQYMFPDVFENPKIFDSIFNLDSSQVNKNKLFLVSFSAYGQF